MKEIPVNIITGFLGSGKTTAIIQLLNQKLSDESWAIVVNEFGKISIDGQTLRSASKAGTVFDISGGCICCSAKGYLRDNLLEIIKTGSFDRIVIEPSGLGGIEMVTELLETLPELRTMPVICMVDITGLGNQRLQMNMIYRAQIAKSDMIVFSKFDLIGDSELQNQSVLKFKALFPEKNRCLLGTMLTPLLLNMEMLNAHAQKNNSPRYLGENSNLTDHNYLKKHLQFGNETIFDCEKLSAFFNMHSEILRAKGHIQTQKGWILFNFSLSGCTFEPSKNKDGTNLVLIAETMACKLLPDLQEEIERTCLQLSNG